MALFFSNPAIGAFVSASINTCWDYGQTSRLAPLPPKSSCPSLSIKLLSFAALSFVLWKDRPCWSGTTCLPHCNTYLPPCLTLLPQQAGPLPLVSLLFCFGQFPTEPSTPSSKIISVIPFHLLQAVLAYFKPPAFPIDPEVLNEKDSFLFLSEFPGPWIHWLNWGNCR